MSDQLHQWTIERQLPGGGIDDWVEICRCSDECNVAEIIRVILKADKAPDVLRIRQVPVGL